MKFLKWPLRLSFHETNLDLEDSSPLGGPISDPTSGFLHTYTPTNTYLNSELASKVKGTSKNENSFKVTGLDLENSQAGTKQGGNGGPNRTNSANIPGGTYTNKKAVNTYNSPPNFTPTIETDPDSSFSSLIQNNSDIQLHRYLPSDIPGGKTYLDIMNTDPENL